MADNPLGGLGNLFGGGFGKALAGMMPQDSPEGNLLKTTAELADLKKQESDILIEIGRQAYSQNPNAWPQTDKLRLIQSNIEATQKTLDEAKRAQEQEEAKKAAEDMIGRCPSCGNRNPQEVKFCQECGCKLGASVCKKCGEPLQPNTRFCGECGANQEG